MSKSILRHPISALNKVTSNPLIKYALILGLSAGILISFGAARVVNAAPSGQGGPTLVLEAPGQVKPGQVISIQLTIENAANIAGYEAAVLYDTSAAEFAGIAQHDNPLRQLGRDIIPLTVVHTPAGSAIGLASCPMANCVQHQGNRVDRGGAGRLSLATLDLLPLKEGVLEIKFDALKFVDAAGSPVQVQVPNSTLSVQVGSSQDRYAAPAPLWSVAAAPGRRGAYDLTRPGLVTHADAMEVALEWSRTREHGAPCQGLSNPRLDVNQDGCLDVADLQSVVANLSPASALGAVTAQGEASLTFTVNSTGDEADAQVGNGVCATAGGSCTLRAAIQEANAHPGPDTIRFNIAGGGVHKIQLQQALDSIHDSSGGVTIDGYSQPGSNPNSDPTVSNAKIMIEIAGKGEKAFDALTITSPNNTIRGLAIFKVRRSFWLYGGNAANNVLVGNFIGTNAAGTFVAPPNTSEEALGIKMEQGAHNNRIGGTAPQDRNVISGNAASGVGLWHVGTSANTLINNIIGLTPDGAHQLANQRHGVDLNFGSANNQIGGTNPGERNVISGNAFFGIDVSHTAQTTQNRILGNYIGTGMDGVSALAGFGNGALGVSLKDRVANNTISQNVIANNHRGGIHIDNLGNCCVSGNQITGNRIGVGANGSAVPNGAFGIWVVGESNQIGPNNIIANNKGPGIQVEGDTSDENRITQNVIFNNQGLGIDLAPLFEVNPNDGGDGDSGPNQQLNYPVIQSATTSQVTGTACGSCTVEVFATGGGTDSNGEAQTFLAQTTAQGDGHFAAAISGVNNGDFVTATAIDAQGNTSEFARNVVVASQPQPLPTATPPLTQNWQSADIQTTFAGETTIQASALTVRGSGRDVWFKADSFRYVYQSASGDVEFTAYLSDWDGARVNNWAKAGIMLRSSADPRAANMLLMVTGTDTVRMQWRTKNGRKTQLSSGFQVNAPIWLKLVKAGKHVTAYYSEDNATWIPVGNPQTIKLSDNFLYGVAVTPHVDGQYTTANFHKLTLGSPSKLAVASQVSDNATEASDAAAAGTVHVGDLKAGKSSDGSTWLGVIDITVHKGNHRPVRYASVIGNWSGGFTGQAKCKTDATGRCALLVENIPNRAGQLTFTFTRITFRKAVYEPSQNHWGKKTGATSIKIKKPKGGS